MKNEDGSTNKSTHFSKFICTICFEELNPIIDDLQAISICGHVFHEICLQQWFESFPLEKKIRCPVCKQQCSQKSVSRLYFQSIPSEHKHTQPDLSQKPFLSTQPHVEALHAEIGKLQGQIAALNQALERQQQYIGALNKELSISKEHAGKETSMKLVFMKENAFIQQLLEKKTEELTRSTIECSILQERTMTLTQELSTHKLSYKELMSQCSPLGRTESRSVKKLEKAVKKINKLNTRLQELETALEEKDKESLNVEAHSVKKLEKAVKKIDKLKIRLHEVEKALEEKDKEALRATKLSTGVRTEGLGLSGLNRSCCHSAPIHNIIDVELEMDDCFIIDAAPAAAASKHP